MRWLGHILSWISYKVKRGRREAREGGHIDGGYCMGQSHQRLAVDRSQCWLYFSPLRLLKYFTASNSITLKLHVSK